MKVNNIFDIFGAIILLAAIGLVVRKPEVFRVAGGQFNTALRTAVQG